MSSTATAERLSQPAGAGELRITALGQAGFALRGATRLVLVDPWLDDRLNGTGLRHPPERLTPAPLAPEQLPRVDVVCITHEHADHLDRTTIACIVERFPDTFVVAPCCDLARLAELGVDRDRLVGLDAGQEVEIADVRVRALPAAHELHPSAFGGYRFWRDEEGRHRALSLLLELDGHRVFHAGDTVWWPGLELELRRAAPELAILPINGRDAMRERAGIVGNLTAAEAAALAAAAAVPIVVPCHFDGVAGNTADPAELRAHAASTVVRILYAGDELSLPADIR